MPTPFDLRSHGYNLVPGDAISVREDREGGLEQTFWLRVKCFNPKVYKETKCKEPGGLAVRMWYRSRSLVPRTAGHGDCPLRHGEWRVDDGLRLDSGGS